MRHLLSRPLFAPLFVLVFALLLGMSAPSGAASDGPAAPGAASAQAPRFHRHFGFAALDSHARMRVIPTDEPPRLSFGLRADEEVVSASLALRFVFSPALTPLQSHVRVLLNGEVIGVLLLKPEDAGKELTRKIPVDAGHIGPFNKLTLEFIGHYTDDCEDPLHSSLWIDFLRGTELRMITQRRRLADDLALLPKPFFDEQDYGRLQLPYVLPAHPSHALLRAAAITSSWFGALADWRGARFPVYLDRLPQAHAVVLATNRERPAFLRDAPPFTGPAIAIVPNPEQPYSKLLLLSGRDGEDLRRAAQALVLGSPLMSGQRVDVTGAQIASPRPPYSAPRWVRLDRPMKFGELIRSPADLQVFGHVPAPVKIGMRIPPDLFTWLTRGVPVNLKLRYTPPIRTIDSTLDMSINGEKVQSVKLLASGHGAESSHVLLPLLDDGLLGGGRELLIPAFKLGARNELQYDFSFSYLSAGACRDVQVENIRAMIDPDSSVDFSGYPHYAELPHLGYFATAGFPFTKYPDLSQTTVVMPRTPTADDIEILLTLMGRMGESTGLPASAVQVAGPDDTAAFANRDLLLIGRAPNQSLLDRWSRYLPAIVAGPHRMIRKPAGRLDALYRLAGIDTDPPPDPVRQTHVRGNGPLSALLGFESPVTPGRSVVAVTSAGPEDRTEMFDTLQDNAITKTLHGSVVLIHGGVVESITAGRTYTVGSLPFWTRIWFPLSGHPVLLAMMAVLAVLIFAFAIWRTLRAVAARRLRGGEDGDQ